MPVTNRRDTADFDCRGGRRVRCPLARSDRPPARGCGWRHPASIRSTTTRFKQITLREHTDTTPDRISPTRCCRPHQPRGRGAAGSGDAGRPSPPTSQCRPTPDWWVTLRDRGRSTRRTRLSALFGHDRRRGRHPGLHRHGHQSHHGTASAIPPNVHGQDHRAAARPRVVRRSHRPAARRRSVYVLHQVVPLSGRCGRPPDDASPAPPRGGPPPINFNNSRDNLQSHGDSA